MNAPLFSIVIPTYNSGKTLEKALDSILFQSYVNLEIIVVDGVSKDNTVDILTRRSALDSRIHFISEKDKGIYDAMNKGIITSQGTWIFFLGSDDTLYDNDTLKKVVESIGDLDRDIVYGNVLKEENGKIYDGPFDLRKLLRRNISHQAMFFNKRIFSSVGNFNLSYPTHADWDFNIRSFENHSVKTRFIEVIVSVFAVGGASSHPDVAFLRHSLLPAKIREIHKYGTKYLRDMAEYDEWWRLIRNSELFKQEQFYTLVQDKEILKIINSIIYLQRLLHQKKLLKGILSKFFMSISYVSNRISKSI